MTDDRGSDEEFFRGELAQAETALRAIAKQAPLLIATGNAAELGAFIDQFVAMARRTAAEASEHPDVAQQLSALVAAAEAIRTVGQK
jgi:hypothetical protein